ncbi:hypothetical protein L248_2240 [Schleiferilactobacillus shenzhenensis LY-73]|uniref:Glycosyl transferase family 1 domain-containing protein n=2 Tax=Schleiferilactobacillus shenzhenensis TaxID=1231337 RepID=U4TQC1_9LACO|nr:hypothetical protein L248_2240 [Schleiferilactobacillus shenzhenensis LY-73]
MKRLQLFLDHDVPAKIVTTNYYSRFHYDFTTNGLTDDTSLNMFDYFLDNLHVPIQKNDAKHWLDAHPGEQTDLGEEQDGNGVAVHGWRIVNGTTQQLIREDVKTGQISSIVYGTTANVVQHSELFDDRGFKTLDIIVDAAGHTQEQRFYSHDGTERILWRFKDNKVTQSIFLKVNDEQRIFMNNDGLISYFLDTINQAAGGDSLIISDRYENTPALAHMKSKARRYVFIHNVHVADPDNPLHDPHLNYNYAYVLQHPREFNGMITPTHHQAWDIKTRFGKGLNVVVIPSGSVDPIRTRIPIINRPLRHHILSVARISPEKRLDTLVKVAAMVREKVPDTILDIYGFVSDRKSGIILNNTVKTTNMVGSVHFHDYTDKIEDVYDDSTLLALSSRNEGFGLALIEAEAHGVPLVSFDINYGPNEIIQNGVNGYLVENADAETMAARIIDIFQNPFLNQKLSDGAYDAAEKFSPQNVWKAWAQIAKLDPAAHQEV